MLAQIAPRHLHQPMTQDEVLLQLRPAQVEEAVAQPQLFRGEVLVARARHGNRRRRGRSDDRQRRRANFDVARRQLGIAHRFGARDDFALDEHDGLGAKRRRRGAHVGRDSASGRTTPARSPRDRADRRTTRPPRSRLRCTQPPRRTRWPTSEARSAPHRCVRRVVARCLSVIEERVVGAAAASTSRREVERAGGWAIVTTRRRRASAVSRPRPRRPDRAGREADSASSSGSFQSSQCTRRGPATVVILLDPPRAVR